MTISADHGARDHATWSASATARNWQCSGAIALALQNPKPEIESEASAWGTACHQLAEKCFRTGKDADEFIGTTEQTKQRKIEVDEEVAETTQVYVDYVRSRIQQYRDETGEEPFVRHEQSLPLDKLGGPFDAGGTGDTVMYFPRWRLIEVVDLKGGRGLVEAADNKQLRTYGLGSLLANPGLNVDKVMTTIVQPRAPHKNGRIRSETFHVADLVEWTAELLERMKLSKRALEEFEVTPFAAWWSKWLTPGNCKFCPNAPCPAQDKMALDAANVWFDDLDRPQISNAPIYDTPEELAKTLDAADMIQDWINAKRARAHQLAESGIEIPNYVLVPKEKREVWLDDVEAKVKQACALLSVDKYLNPAKLKTPKQVRKALGKAKESLVAGLSETPSGGTNLVRADKTTRQAIPAAVDRFFNDESENV